MKFNKRQKAIFALILANTIWGAASPIFKWSLENLEPFTLAFLRFYLAALLLYPFVWKKLNVQREDWPKLIILSLLGITANISFFFLGLKLSPSINAPIIATAGPVFMLLGCLFILKEKLKLRVILGTAIGVVGVLVIILRPLLENGFDPSVLGNLFFVLATLGAVGHTILTKKLAPKYDPITITFWSFAIGATTFIPFLAYEVNNYGFLTGLDLSGIIGILFGVVLCSLVAYSMFHWAIKHLFAQEVGIFAYLDPIIAVLIAAPLLGEIPTPTYLLGSLLVVSGIVIAEGYLPNYPLHKLRKFKEGLIESISPA